MSSIADSNAIRDDDRVLPQHQAAITLMQGWLADPGVGTFTWLDLACGRGQILTGIEGGLSENARSKIYYTGYDMREEYTRETKKLAASLGFHAHGTKVGYLTDFPKLCPRTEVFDFITLTNTVHEVEPAQLAFIFLESIVRLSNSGCLFIYDMERIRPPELGAVPWTTTEMSSLLNSLLAALGIDNYEPSVGQWRHRTCDAWNVQIYREHFELPMSSIDEHLKHAHRVTTDAIVRLLEAKLARCKSALENLTVHGPDTADEQEEKDRLLYEFWAVNRALGGSE